MAEPRLSEATTAPVVGLMVRVPSAFVTEETPVEIQVLFRAKQPAVRLMPFAKVEEAAVLEMRRRSVMMPPA